MLSARLPTAALSLALILSGCGSRGRPPAKGLAAATRAAGTPTAAPVFEPKLPFAAPNRAPAFQPAAAQAKVDKRHLLAQLGDERFWGLVGIGDPLLGPDILAAFDFRGVLTSEGLVVPSFISKAGQVSSEVASLWDPDGRLRGHLDGVRYITDLAGARDAPLVAFATTWWATEDDPFAYGVWLFNTRENKFYARRFCPTGVALAVALTPSGHTLAALCYAIQTGEPRDDLVKPRALAWDLRTTDPKPICEVAMPDDGDPWHAPELQIAGRASPMVLSDDGQLLALVTDEATAVFRTSNGERIAELETGLPIHLDEERLLLLAGDERDRLTRVALSEQRAELLAADVSAAAYDPEDQRVYWARGATLTARTGGKDTAIGLTDFGVTHPGEKLEIKQILVPSRRRGDILVRVSAGPVVRVSRDLRTASWKQKLPAHATSLRWTTEGAVAANVQFQAFDFTWHPGSSNLGRHEAAEEKEVAPPPYTIGACNDASTSCVDVGGYILGPWCSLERPTAGIYVGNLILADGPERRPPEAKVFAARFTDELDLTTWTIPRYHSGCAVAADALSLVIALDDDGIVAYRATGEVIWKNQALHGAGVLAYTPKHVVASVGNGEIAWLDATNGELRRRWQAHQHDCGLLAAVHPNGDRLATAGCDEAIRVWRLTP